MGVSIDRNSRPCTEIVELGRTRLLNGFKGPSNRFDEPNSDSDQPIYVFSRFSIPTYTLLSHLQSSQPNWLP